MPQARGRLAWLDISLPQRGAEGLTTIIPALPVSHAGNGGNYAEPSGHRFADALTHGAVHSKLLPHHRRHSPECPDCHLLCADKSNAEIAQIMDVKLPTVKTHVRHIIDKLDVKRWAEAKTAAKKLHLVPEEL